MKKYEESWDSIELARAMVYGLVATLTMGKHLHTVPLTALTKAPRWNIGIRYIVFPFLYIMKKPSDINDCVMCTCISTPLLLRQWDWQNEL